MTTKATYLPKRIKVSVTADDITNGVKDNCKLCPIALAVVRLLPQSDAIVSYHSCAIRSGQPVPPWVKYKLSQSAKHFVRRFDNGLSVKPATFIFERS